jgi:hypothetical protein
MKKLLFSKLVLSLVFTSFFVYCGFAQTIYTWQPTIGIHNFTAPSNWAPPRNTPAPTDILKFSNAGNTTITNVPTQTVAQIDITNNTTVNLQAADVAGNTLTIAGGTVSDLNVDINANLNVDGANVLTLFFTTGAGALVSGNITFSRANHRMDAASPGGVQFQTGSVFTQGLSCNGEVFTTSGTNDAIIFKNGSIFNQLDGANPFGKTQPASKVVFNTGSLFHFQVPAQIPSFSGRTYADLRYTGSPGQTLNSFGNRVLIDNLTVASGTLNFGPTGNPGHAIKGNITVDNGAQLNFSSFPPTAGTVNLSGTSTQTISNNGSLTFSPVQTINIDNPANVILNTSITIPNRLTLTNGNVVLGANNLSVGDITGAFSPNTHIVTNGTGTLTIPAIGVTPKVFPIGHNATNINAISIANGNNRDYSARVVQGFPFAIFDPTRAVDRTWYVKANTAPAAMVDITFNYANGDGGPAFINNAPIDFGIYTNAWQVPSTNLTPTGTYEVAVQTGALQTNTELPMVIGNLGAILTTANCFTNFKAVTVADATHLHWVAQCASPIKLLELQRSESASSFNTIATSATLINSFIDDKPLVGKNYYRLKITYNNGSFEYSNIIAILNNDGGFEMVSIAPNIATTNTRLSVAAAKSTQVTVVITDVTGRKVSSKMYTINIGGTILDVDVTKLATGSYYLTATTPQGDVKTGRFIKQ